MPGELHAIESAPRRFAPLRPDADPASWCRRAPMSRVNRWVSNRGKVSRLLARQRLSRPPDNPRPEKISVRPPRIRPVNAYQLVQADCFEQACRYAPDESRPQTGHDRVLRPTKHRSRSYGHYKATYRGINQHAGAERDARLGSCVRANISRCRETPRFSASRRRFTVAVGLPSSSHNTLFSTDRSRSHPDVETFRGDLESVVEAAKHKSLLRQPAFTA